MADHGASLFLLLVVHVTVMQWFSRLRLTDLIPVQAIAEQLPHSTTEHALYPGPAFPPYRRLSKSRIFRSIARMEHACGHVVSGSSHDNDTTGMFFIPGRSNRRSAQWVDACGSRFIVMETCLTFYG
jgi:hypothetical protein